MDSALQQRLDSNYRYQRHVYDLSREYYLLGRDRLIANLAPPDGGTVLEIGCGTARNLIAAARRYPKAKFYGIDLSLAMLETAAKSLAKSGIGERIRIAHGDATSFDPEALFDVPRFDRIFFSYALSMIPPWREAITWALPRLAPGGAMHIVDFGTGQALPRPANAMLRAWLAKFHVTPRDELEPFLRALTTRHPADLEIVPLFRTYAISAVVTARA